MVAKQLIKVANNSPNTFMSYMDIKQTYIALAQYLKKFQQASELIKGGQYEFDAIHDFEVGTHLDIVISSIKY